VYGVSFLVAWSSLALLNAVDVICRDPLKRLAWQAEIILPLAVVMAAFIHGTNQLHVTENKSAPVANVTFIQPSIPQAMIWNDAEDGRRFAQLLDLTRTALSQDTDLLLWPEAALPNVGQAELTALTDLVHERRVWMILGADDSHFGPGGVDYFNAAVLLNPRGESAGVYHKRKLVMFGEYVPASRWLPFLKHLTPISGGFTPGEHPVQFRLERRSADGKNISSSGLKTSTLICFEDIFPDLVRGYVDDDTDFLVNITNNGWFGEGAAQWQHAAATVFRAVENGVPLLRCANNGVTCWVDERGRIREVFHDAHGTIYGAGAMTAHIPLRAPGSPRVQTFYNRHGDWFGWVCVGVASLSLLARIVSLRRAKREAV
jgi:apolipoprotein N-acyltransferase